ncbi:MAG: 6-carboxytetrahydropterin synthase, partial [Planctomycetaceae bacterium]|nr:6-carboxytetrahydropterin synthase [Planctomycetaceae bacterium]
DDENGIAAIRSVVPTKYFLLSDNPTAENMARYLLETVCPELLHPYGVDAIRVALWETEETCAIATRDADRGESPYSALVDHAPLESPW